MSFPQSLIRLPNDEVGAQTVQEAAIALASDPTDVELQAALIEAVAAFTTIEYGVVDDPLGPVDNQSMVVLHNADGTLTKWCVCADAVNAAYTAAALNDKLGA